MANNEAETEAEESPEGEAPEPKSKKKRMIMIVVVLLLALMAAKMFVLKPKPLTAAAKAAKAKTEEIAVHDKCAAANGLKLIDAKTTPTTVSADQEKVLAPNDSSVTVNLADGSYLKVGIALQLDTSIDPKAAKDDGLGARATDITLHELERHTMAGLAPPSARTRVQQQLSFDVCKAYDGKVTSVYFTEFVMQAA